MQPHFKEIMERNKNRYKPEQGKNSEGEKKRFSKPRSGAKGGFRPGPKKDREEYPFSDEKRPSGKRPYAKDKSYSKNKPYSKERPFSKDKPYSKDKPFSKDKSYSKDRPYSKNKPYSKDKDFSKGKLASRKGKSAPAEETPVFEEPVRLNRYLANAGICSRREADKLIQSGAVSINGEVVTELGTKVGPRDKVQFGGETLSREQPRYLLLNKPKDFLTTSDDPMNRRTVMSLVENACKERIYPVGRLDRNTTGLLLFTNDGELAKKLMHPKFGIKKIYHVHLDKNLAKNDFIQIAEGLELEDGFIRPDNLAYVAQVEDKKQIGIELHSGKNRIVRRIFEHLGYEVVKLDRVFYAGLTKKDLPRGKWRFLTPQEINLLKRI